MIFTFTDEQRELAATLRRFLQDKSPSSEVRRLMATPEGYDPQTWAQLAGQLGLQGLAIPEKYGGSGAGPVELAIVCEEMGRALLCAPYFATAVLAAHALLASGDQAAAEEFLPSLADGGTIATLAVCEDDGAWTTDGLQTTARRSGDGYRLDGRKSFVLDGHTADLLLVVAQAEDGPSLFAVPGDADGLARRLAGDARHDPQAGGADARRRARPADRRGGQRGRRRPANAAPRGRGAGRRAGRRERSGAST